MAGIEVELSDVHAAMRKNVGNVTCMADTAMRRPAGMRPQSRWHCGHIICSFPPTTIPPASRSGI
jgi:hypothetical protein